MKITKITLAIALVFGCSNRGTETETEPTPIEPTLIEQLQEKYDARLAEARAEADPATGWMDLTGCDEMLWTGKFAGVSGTVDIRAASYETRGKYYRNPTIGSCSSAWSRDMGLGFFTYAWMQNDRSALEGHATYGLKHDWFMGPVTDGREIYTPNMVGLLYQLIYRLGGEDNINRKWPSTYPSGLNDYHAHLQMLQIWLRNEADGEVTKKMRDRVFAHSDRQASCPFYNVMAHAFTDGDFTEGISLLIAFDRPQCDYLRCGNDKTCFDAEWLWSAQLILDRI